MTCLFWGSPKYVQALGVDSPSFLNKKAVFPGFPEVFYKEGSLERMGRYP